MTNTPTTSLPSLLSTSSLSPSSRTALYYSGFNGFGQFENDAQQIAHKPTEFTIPTNESSSISTSPLIACTWSYNAIAIDANLWVSGSLWCSTPDEMPLHFDAVIRKVAVNDRWCLVLLVTGHMHKVCIQTGAVTKLQFIGGIDNIDCGDKSPSAHVASSPQQPELPKRRKLFEGFLKLDLNDELCPNDLEMIAEHVSDIASCHTFSVALSNKNALYCVPSLVHRFSSSERIVKMCGGAEHVVLLTANGDVYVFGSALRGQLGQGNSTDTADAPVLLEALAGIRCVDIGAGAWHTAAVSAFGDLYTWGWNINGQTGRAVYGRRSTDGTRQKLPTVFATADVIDLPRCKSGENENDDREDDDEEIALQNQYEVRRVWCGARHTVVQTSCGKLLGCGWNRYGQLGAAVNKSASSIHDDATEDNCSVDRFVEIDVPIGVASVVCGSWCTVFVCPGVSNEIQI